MSRDNNKFKTSFYRKLTLSGVYTNFGSFIPKSHKYNLLFTLLHRALKLCSSFELFHQEYEKLKTIFEKNGYPKRFVDICIRKYFDIVFIKKEVVLKSSKKELICILPFIGNKSLQLRIRSVNSIENKAWLAHLISRFACKARVIVHASLSPPVSRIKIVATKTKYQIIK